jgi:hypothetical protein
MSWEGLIMKRLFCVVAIVFSSNACASEFELPRGLKNEEEIEDLKRYYACGDAENTYDTKPLKQALRQRVEQDEVAAKAMELFIDCKHWHLVDYCEDNLTKMTQDNNHLFMEVVALSAPWLEFGDYTARAVRIIGDSKSVKQDYFQHRGFIYDMFFYAAVENGKRGHSWIIIDNCVNVCNELEMLAKMFGWAEYERFGRINVDYLSYSGKCRDYIWQTSFTNTWPNLPDANTWRRWASGAQLRNARASLYGWRGM